MAILHRTKTVPGLTPRYLARFACIGSACEDTCCVGWSVPLDKKTYKAYRQSTDPVLAPRFAHEVMRTELKPGCASQQDDFGRMALVPGTNACTMLDGQKMCSIQSRLGESYLSDTCSQYPRITRVFNGQHQQGLRLSCPEAARQALLAPDAFEFDETELHLRPTAVYTLGNLHGLPAPVVDETRIFCLNLMRIEGVPLWQRLAVLGVLCERLDQMLAAGEQRMVPALLQEFVDLIAQGDVLKALDPMRPDHAAQAVVFATLLAGKSFVTLSPVQAAINARVEAGLGADRDGMVTAEQLIAGYTHGVTRLPEALEAAPHLLDHYILNEMFTVLFPFAGGTPYSNFLQLISRFGVLRFMLAAQCNTQGSLPDTAALVATVHVHCRRFQHDPAFADKVIEAMQASGWDTLDKLFGFLRS